MEDLKDLIRESVIVQGTMALTILGTVCYMYAQGMDVPELLAGFLGTILGYYFGTKAQQKLSGK